MPQNTLSPPIFDSRFLSLSESITTSCFSSLTYFETSTPSLSTAQAETYSSPCFSIKANTATISHNAVLRTLIAAFNIVFKICILLFELVWPRNEQPGCVAFQSLQRGSVFWTNLAALKDGIVRTFSVIKQNIFRHIFIACSIWTLVRLRSGTCCHFLSGEHFQKTRVTAL